MPLINTEDKLIAALEAAPSRRSFMKFSGSSEGGGTFLSLWKVGSEPPAGANPPLFSAGAGYVATKATLGARAMVDAVVNGDLSLLKLAFSATNTGVLFVYDRIWACSGFNTTVLTAQAVTTPGTLPVGRNPNGGLDVEPWLEIYTAPGATAATWTLTGTDALGNVNRTWTYAHPANPETVGQMAPFAPGGATPAAVNGCREVTSLTCSVSSALAGDVGVTLLRRLMAAPHLSLGAGAVLDALATGLPPVFNDSCIAMMIFCSSTSNTSYIGDLVIGEAP